MSKPEASVRRSGNGASNGDYSQVLVVAAHPDDPEFLFGATIAKLVADGAEVRYVVCSDGANGSRDPSLPRSELASLRCEEQRAAAAALGVRDVAFLGFPDGLLAPTSALRAAIARQIRRSKPDLVLTHFPQRALQIPIEASHPDHIAVGEATLAAVFPDAANARAHPELFAEGLAPHRVKEVWIPGYQQADHFVDATAFMEKKIQAICYHTSQVGGADPRESLAWVYRWMQGAGREPGYEYAETYQRIRL